MRFSNPILCLSAAAAQAVAQAAYTPTEFTSAFEIVATPDQVVNANNTFTGGLAGASGLYRFMLNSKENVICYNISLSGFRGEYQSPATTATHIHQSAAGRSGPPRIAFPNPIDDGTGVRRSSGCIQGTANGFITGVTNATTSQDQGFGFQVKQIEDDPSAFNADVHSSEAVPGAVRGQFSAAIVPSAYPSGSTTLATSASTSGAVDTVVAGVTVTESCTKYPTCHETPAPETPVAPVPTPYGTGAWTPPAAPSATGGYVPPPPASSATWVPPAGPTPTHYEPAASQPSTHYTPSASESVVPYTGAAVKQSVFGGLVAVVVFTGMAFVL